MPACVRIFHLLILAALVAATGCGKSEPTKAGGGGPPAGYQGSKSGPPPGMGGTAR